MVFSKKYIALVLALVAALALGFIMGGFVMGRETHRGGLDARIAAYIAANPEAIENALIARNQTKTINLLTEAQDKTIIGNPQGDITIYEFSDYNCGFCKRVFADLMEVVENDGNIRLVVKEYPILAETSVTAARLALHAAEIGKFEPVHHALMQWRGAITPEMLTELATKHGINNFTLEAPADDPTTAQLVQNRNIGQALNITGTPSFIIGNEIIRGAISKAQIRKAIRLARSG